MLKRNLKLVQASRSAGAIPIAVNEPILVSRRFNSIDPVFFNRHFTGFIYYHLIVECGGLVGRSVGLDYGRVCNKIYSLI